MGLGLWWMVFGLELMRMWIWMGGMAWIDGGGRCKEYVNRTR